VLDLALTGAFQLVISDVILTELERTLGKPYFARRLGSALITQYLAGLKAVAVPAAVTAVVAGGATHPEDDAILAAAVSAHADYLVTGDKALQALRTFSGVTIVAPSDVVRLVGRPSPPAAAN
jgi:putative PIN family toxin of toxin-antitoxin system